MAFALNQTGQRRRPSLFGKGSTTPLLPEEDSSLAMPEAVPELAQRPGLGGIDAAPEAMAASQEKKPNMFASLFNRKQEAPQFDELGVQKPQESKEGIGTKIARYAIPTALSLFGGAGALPGILSAFTQGQAMKNAATAAEQERYGKERAQKMKSLFPEPTSGQQDFEYFQSLDPAAQENFMKLKSAASMNPLALAKFDFEKYKFANPPKKESPSETLARLPANQAVDLGEAQYLPEVLEDLKQTIAKNASAAGPVMGRLRALNPYDAQSQVLQSKIEKAKQMVGKFLEGGVLRKEDVAKYEAILASIGNDPKVATAKIDSVGKDLAEKYNRTLESLGNARYDVSRFKSMQLGGKPKNENHSEAIQWAEQNPTDPRSKAILEKARAARKEATSGF